jgi:D-alanyl-lipoteichoic acid acyltransferase DltB (MBOAT superfamily)
MTLAHIAAFIAAALIYALLPARWRGWFILAGSFVAVYILQPPLAVRWLDFTLPSLTIILTIACWWLTRLHNVPVTRADWAVVILAAAVVLALIGLRDVRPELRPTPSRPPDFRFAIGFFAALGVVSLFGWRLSGRKSAALLAGLLVIIATFIVLKTEPLTVAAAAFLRGQTGQQTDLASVTDIGWLGFSYIAFRLLHTIRDRQMGTLPNLTLREYAAYVLFFPAFTAGPIDRAERFVKDFRSLNSLAHSRYVVGGYRIGIGVLKKFVIADSLALFALNPVNAAQTESTLWLWLLVYAFALRLYFDFSGYSDIAIGIGVLYGINLPENFDRPYARSNLTAFWQSWHITLSSWARLYVFSPISRTLLIRKLPAGRVVLVAQLTTMLTIGIWHGVTPNFALWGLWHGLGLYIHKQWSDRTRSGYRKLQERPIARRIWSVAGWLLTFHFVALGWVWFALPDFTSAINLLARLFGGGR